MSTVSISTQTFDIDGVIALSIDQTSELTGLTRRVSRTATLDGGAVVNDQGFSDSDRTFILRFRKQKTLDALKLERIIKLYPLIILSTNEGAFLGAISDYNNDDTLGNLTFLVRSRVSA